MNNLKDIHNYMVLRNHTISVVYQDFNEQFEGYTQPLRLICDSLSVVYQDFNEQFEGYTQLLTRLCRFIERCLSGFQ